MIIKTIINLVEIYILAKILYKTGKFFFTRKIYGKNKRGKSIAGKIGYMISNKLHDLLDNMIKSQKAKRLAEADQQTQEKDEVTFTVYKRVKDN